MAMMEPLIYIDGLYKSFGELQVLKGFRLDLFDGENLVIVGRSGSGKSVLLKCIIGLLEPDAGMLEVLGKSIAELKQDELDRLRTEPLSVITPQDIRAAAGEERVAADLSSLTRTWEVAGEGDTVRVLKWHGYDTTAYAELWRSLLSTSDPVIEDGEVARLLLEPAP